MTPTNKNEHTLEARDAAHVASKLRAIDQARDELRGALALLIAQSELEGTWEITGDGKRLVRLNPPKDPPQAA
jgi:hypothetical protein